MTYYDDLTPYAETKSFTPLRNVGWLSGWRSYPKDKTPADWAERLWEYVDHGTTPTRGYQPCPICCRWSLQFAGRKPITEPRDGTMYQLGSRELRVFGRDGGFATPDLVIHYILRHQYRPPSEFWEALQKGPRPGSREYLERFHAALGSSPGHVDGPTEKPVVLRKDLFRIPPELLDDAEYFESEPSPIEIEERAYFAERSGFDGVVHVRVDPNRLVVEAGRVRVEAARLRNTPLRSQDPSV